MKHAAIKTKSALKSGLIKAKPGSKTANQAAIEANSKRVRKENVPVIEFKSKTAAPNKKVKKGESAVKNITRKSSTRKKTGVEDKPVKKRLSKNFREAAVSVKKTNSPPKSETLKTRPVTKSKVSKVLETVKTKARNSTLPKTLNEKKSVSKVKIKAAKPEKVTQKVSSKPRAAIKTKKPKTRILAAKKSAKPVQKKAENLKSAVKIIKPKLPVAVQTKKTKTTGLTKSGRAAKPLSKIAKPFSEPVKSNNKKAVVKKLSRLDQPKSGSKTISTLQKTQTKIQPQKKSSTAEKTKNKTIKAADKVLSSKNKKSKIEKAVKPLTAQKKVQIAKNKIVEKVSAKKAGNVKNLSPSVPVEIKKPKKKPVRPISSAVFRGKKSQYDFKVFSIDEKFEPLQAVYIISRRITDRRKRGHHKLICIGQTDSLIDGIKMHKKGKCIRQNEANVICLLREEDEKNRLRIEADLREAHSVICNRQ